MTYSRNLQWKNRKEPSGAPKTINIEKIKIFQEMERYIKFIIF